ncbi:hypothetical protein [Lentzea sp. NPDC003310]|uniref:hypothetical protein n=1 Tax=Lentzea sp. NPDC003310 TaxID=3154447 RepID=UPI0033B5F468
MTDIEIAVGLLIARMTRPAHLEREHLGTNRDGTSEPALQLVYEMITTKLSGDPALERLALEVNGSGQIRPRTRARLAMALEDAAEDDLHFAKELEAAVKEAQKLDRLEVENRGSVTNQITGNVSGRVIQARDIHGGVTFHDGSKGK